MHYTRLASGKQHATSQCEGMDISCARLQASDQLSCFQVPDIDLAVKASAIEKRAFPRQGKYRLPFLSAVFQCADRCNQAPSCWVNLPQQNAPIASSRYQHFFRRGLGQNAFAQQHAVHIAIVGKLVDVLASNLQILSPYRISRLSIGTKWLRCLRAARAKRVEEAVLALRGV